jgi:AraC-like DNA-binding protein
VASDVGLIQAHSRRCQLLVGAPNREMDALNFCSDLRSSERAESLGAEEIMRGISVRFALRLIVDELPLRSRTEAIGLVTEMAQGPEDWRPQLITLVQHVRLVRSLHIGRDGEPDRRFEDVIRFLESRIGTRPHLCDAAKELRLSKFHLCRLIRTHSGHGFTSLLRAVRIRHAEQLLSNNALSVKEVAAMVGYSDTASLDRDFRKLRGMCPSEWRCDVFSVSHLARPHKDEFRNAPAQRIVARDLPLTSTRSSD